MYLCLIAVLATAPPAADFARARHLFALGDYPACEKELRTLLAGPAGPGTAEHVESLAQLARALTFQDIHEEAIGVLEKALRITDDRRLRRLAITVLLRAGRFGAILPHADSLLAVASDEPFAHFVRGIALSHGDRLQEALRELAWGLAIPTAKRDAHFHLALVNGKLKEHRKALEYLLEIVVDDPYDQEACYQATQQLARLGARKTAAFLRQYYAAFTKAQGEASRNYPLEAVGRAATAAILRAEKWRRLRVYERVLPEIRRAQAVARGDPEPYLYEADFWAGVGLYAEAAATLSRLETLPLPAGLPEDVLERVQKLRVALAAAREKTRSKVATARWPDALPFLERQLADALTAGKPAVADHAARLLLARDPASIRALALLAERAATPALLVPRLHYLTHLARLLPDNDRYRARLRAARDEFLGNRSTGNDSPRSR